MNTKVRRLFEQFQPEHYQLEMRLDSEAMRFSGIVTITGKKTGRPSQRITFHQNGLTVSAATIVRHDKRGDQTFEVARINHHQSFNEVRLHTGQLLYAGTYTVTLEFSGKITKHMEGIYPCFYKHDGKDKKLIATQFESHHAREAFPCVDEPEAKATFDLTLITPKNQIILANTPVKNQIRESAEFLRTDFETTPRMSTYLLAFVVGDLHCVEGQTKRGVKVRSWATVAQQKSHLEYANREAIAYLDFFEDYFRTPFPLPKIDQAALPDFEFMAMENWGLVTFREVGLLADPANRSISGEQLISLVIAHELSHQWFGNLVTMKWWDDLWLNESFASIMETLAPDKLHPDWHAWEEFTSGRVISAADRDIYKDVQPVGVRVNHPSEIATLFDPAIVYAKGARALKMLFDFIGEEKFREGLANYFKKFQYQNTTRADLWQCLSDASGTDIGALMTPWIEQSGTPELTVAAKGEALEVSQRRFLLDGEDAESLWPIPLLADQLLGPNVLNARAGIVKPAKPGATPLFNPNGSGHFITRYEGAGMAKRLRASIQDRSLPSNGRIVGLSDMLLLARHGEQSLAEILRFVADCATEDRDAVWSMFMRVIGNAQVLSEGNEVLEDKLKQYRRDLSANWFQKLGWDDAADDDPNTKHLRTTMLALQIGGEDKQAIGTALQKFETAQTVEALPAEQRALIAGTAVRFGKPAYVDQLIKEYETTHSPDTRKCIAAALCSTHDEKIARQVVEWGMFDDQIIKPQDIDQFFAHMMRNRYIRHIGWQWLVDRWPYLEHMFGCGKSMEYFIWYASRPLSTPEWQQRYREFFEPKLSDVSMKRNITISFAEIEARVAWRRREEPQLEKYFSNL